MPDFTNNAIKLGGVISQRPPFRPPPNLWRTVTINFDDVASGTAVDSTYAGSGVTFASVTYPPRTWSAFAKEMPWGGGQSGKNILTIIEADPSYPWFDARYGALEATFSHLLQSVSVWAYAMDSPEGSGNADNRQISGQSADAVGGSRCQLPWPLASAEHFLAQPQHRQGTSLVASQRPALDLNRLR